MTERGIEQRYHVVMMLPWGNGITIPLAVGTFHTAEEQRKAFTAWAGDAGIPLTEDNYEDGIAVASNGTVICTLLTAVERREQPPTSERNTLAALKDLMRLVSHNDMAQHWDAEALTDSVECALEYAREAIGKAEEGVVP